MPEVSLPVMTISEADPPTEASLVSTDDQPVVTAVPVSIENLILVEEEKKRVRKGNKKVGFVLALSFQRNLIIVF